MENAPAVYVHIPFCVRRCPYCAFASSVYSAETADHYLEALALELSSRVTGLHPRTLYVGGGTPTSLSREQLARLMSWLRSCLGLDNLVEFTVEANPGTLDLDKLMLLRDAGVNRVSLGAQSFSTRGLAALGRAHNARQTRAAVAFLREAGFENISLDLIYGWPGQKLADWKKDLETALKLEISHLSCYCLSYEPGTALAQRRERGEIVPVGEDAEREMFDLAGEALERGGFRRYEISNFAPPGNECLHNLNYWTGGEYHGVGAGAHSHLAGSRFANCDDVRAYMMMIRAGGGARVFEEKLEPEKRARELAVIWLRLLDGIDAGRFRNGTGYTLRNLFKAELPELLSGGWLEWKNSRLRLTAKALPLADCVMAELVGD